jgi:hypothetical protein
MAAFVPDPETVAQHIVEMTNQVRREQNLSSLKVNSILAKAAQGYARSLAQSGAFSHTADGRTPAVRAESAGYKPCAIAENLAMERTRQSFATGQLAIEIMAGWMNSPAHRANITMPTASEVGVGIAEAPTAKGTFIAVELIAQPASAAYTFQIVNAAHVAVTFTFAGKERVIEPNLSATQTSCHPSEIVFSAPGGAFSAAREIARLPAQDQKIYTLKPDTSGNLSVEVTARHAGP